MIGASVSFLAWFTAEFILYGISNIGNISGILVDPLLEAVPGALAGGAIAAVLRNVRPYRSLATYAGNRVVIPRMRRVEDPPSGPLSPINPDEETELPHDNIRLNAATAPGSFTELPL
jgi:hypothetical protein